MNEVSQNWELIMSSIQFTSLLVDYNNYLKLTVNCDVTPYRPG